jgi:hypothetical protein
MGEDASTRPVSGDSTSAGFSFASLPARRPALAVNDSPELLQAVGFHHGHKNLFSVFDR